MKNRLLLCSGLETSKFCSFYGNLNSMSGLCMLLVGRQNVHRLITFVGFVRFRARMRTELVQDPLGTF